MELEPPPSCADCFSYGLRRTHLARAWSANSGAVLTQQHCLQDCEPDEAFCEVVVAMQGPAGGREGVTQSIVA